MSTRIRYVSAHTDTNHTLMSLRVFKGHEAKYRMYLYTLDNVFEVKNEDTGEVVAKGTGKSLNMLKIYAKRALVGLGVEFDNEKRVSV